MAQAIVFCGLCLSVAQAIVFCGLLLPINDMVYYRRRLPHWIPDHATLFVTWRVAGPVWLRDPRVAAILEQALHHGEKVREMYTLDAWVIMPDHMHVILKPHETLPQVMCWLKGRTARKANRILGRTGLPFWQQESYDHWIRSAAELRDLVFYVEQNPVHAGLVASAEQWPWSSARHR